MEKFECNRRIFMGGAAMLGGIAAVRPDRAIAHDQCGPGPIPDPALGSTKVRRNIFSLDPSGPEIQSLRQGVAAMKARPVDDPTSWLFQANIHGTVDNPPQGMPAELSSTWSTCEHSSYFFLSWHRIYLFFFERILRDASGDADFALPYWNYEIPGQRVLPLPLREPADTSNPLFVSQRRTFGPNINGGEPVPVQVTSSSEAMRTTFFGSPTVFGLTWQLEMQPHNVMHGVIGGSGWMSDPRFAARDPVFWLHHANIDRLWSVWNAQGGGREDPVNDAIWMDTTFAFFDETGAKVEMSGSDVLNTADQLDYRYDDEPEPEIGLVLVGGGDGAETSAAGSTELAAPATESGITLGASPIDIGLAAQVDGTEAFTTNAASPAAQPVLLELGMIDYAEPSGHWYEIYINLPEGAEPETLSAYYAGNASFFAQSRTLRENMNMKGEHQPVRLDITGLLNRQIQEGLWDGGEIVVQFRPNGLETATESMPVDQQISIGSIRIVRQ